MLKKNLLVIIALFLILPVWADYNPLSDEPIENVEEFYFEENSKEATSPEFEYTVGEPKKDITESSSNSYDSNTTNTTENKAENKTTVIDTTNTTTKTTKDYAGIYNSLEPAKHSYMHNIDPDQYYDMKDATWAPYPLLRLNSYIYFKDRSIEPGYYLLTPREHKDKWYLLFKQNGKVVHIIPVYERDITPQFFYDEHLSKPKLTKAQKVHMGVLSFLGKFDSTKRKDPIKSYMEITDLENHFVSIIIYYGNHKYSTIFRTIKL